MNDYSSMWEGGWTNYSKNAFHICSVHLILMHTTNQVPVKRFTRFMNDDVKHLAGCIRRKCLHYAVDEVVTYTHLQAHRCPYILVGRYLHELQPQCIIFVLETDDYTKLWYRAGGKELDMEFNRLENIVYSKSICWFL